jgi:hypothetical protein
MPTVGSPFRMACPPATRTACACGCSPRHSVSAVSAADGPSFAPAGAAFGRFGNRLFPLCVSGPQTAARRARGWGCGEKMPPGPPSALFGLAQDFSRPVVLLQHPQKHLLVGHRIWMLPTMASNPSSTPGLSRAENSAAIFLRGVQIVRHRRGGPGTRRSCLQSGMTLTLR